MATIGIFDSGVGGLSIFKEIRELLPNERYFYYGDSANCPYGIKGPEFIRNRSLEITDKLVSQGAQLIVVACNTATSYAIDSLRRSYPTIHFVGTVPGVKPAAQITKTGIIGVLATYGTLNAPLYKQIRDTWGANVQVLEREGKGFVEIVERLDFESDNAENVVRKVVEPLIEAKADTLVLGCTHYPFLVKTIEKVANRIAEERNLGFQVNVYNPAMAIAKHVRVVLEENNIEIGSNQPQTILWSSGDENLLNKLYNIL